MGLSNVAKKNYVQLYKGKLTLKCEKGTMGAISRGSESGSILWYVPYDRLTGHIVAVDKKEREWNGKTLTSLNIVFESERMHYILSLGWQSSTANVFLNCMENIDFKKEVIVEASWYNEKDYIFFKQEENNVKPYYTKENPGEKPDWKQKKVNGKKIWDRTDELLYFDTIINGIIYSRIQEALIFQDDNGTIKGDGNINVELDPDNPSFWEEVIPGAPLKSE